MSALMNAKISTKILSAIGVISVIVLCGALYAAKQMQAIDETYTDIITHDDVTTANLARTSRYLSWYGRDAYAVTVSTSEDEIKRLMADLADTQQKAETFLNIATTAALPENKARIEPLVREIHGVFAACADPIKAGASTINPDEIAKVLVRLEKECDPPLEKATIDARQLINQFSDQAIKNSKQARDDSQHTITVVLISIISGLAFGVVVALWISKAGITNPLSDLGETMEKLASGNLAVQVVGAGIGRTKWGRWPAPFRSLRTI